MAERKVKRGQVCFVVSGEDLARIVRNLTLERRWRSAWSILENLGGITKDQITEILSGEKVLTGDSSTGIGIKDWSGPEQADYRKGLSDLYGGLLEYNGFYFQPYARVTSWCRQDIGGPPARFVNRFMPTPRIRTLSGPDGDVSIPLLDSEWRSIYYAKDPANDLSKAAVVKGDKTVVLFQEVRDPPLWVKPTHDPQEAVDGWLKAGHRLPARGGHEFERLTFEEKEAESQAEVFKRSRPELADGEDRKAKPEEAEEVVQSQDERRPPLDTSLPPLLNAFLNDPDRTMAAMATQQNMMATGSDPVLYTDPFNGWLDPMGKMVSCHYGLHASVAANLVPKGEPNPERWLEQNGWVKLSKGEWIVSERGLSDWQKTFIRDWCFDHKRTPPSDAKED